MEKVERLTVFGFKGRTYYFNVYPLDAKHTDEAGICIITKRDNAPNALHTIIHISSAASFKEIDNAIILNCREKYGANCMCLLPVKNEEDRLLIEAELRDRYTTVGD